VIIIQSNYFALFIKNKKKSKNQGRLIHIFTSFVPELESTNQKKKVQRPADLLKETFQARAGF